MIIIPDAYRFDYIREVMGKYVGQPVIERFSVLIKGNRRIVRSQVVIIC